MVVVVAVIVVVVVVGGVVVVVVVVAAKSHTRSSYSQASTQSIFVDLKIQLNILGAVSRIHVLGDGNDVAEKHGAWALKTGIAQVSLQTKVGSASICRASAPFHNVGALDSGGPQGASQHVWSDCISAKTPNQTSI